MARCRSSVAAGFEFLAQSAAFNVLLIHSEADCFSALAAASIAFNSSGVTRTRKVSFLAFPFGSGGLPTFLAFACFGLGIPELLNDCRSGGFF
jgi:hypothetical protein